MAPCYRDHLVERECGTHVTPLLYSVSSVQHRLSPRVESSKPLPLAPTVPYNTSAHSLTVSLQSPIFSSSLVSQIVSKLTPGLTFSREKNIPKGGDLKPFSVLLHNFFLSNRERIFFNSTLRPPPPPDVYPLLAARRR